MATPGRRTDTPLDDALFEHGHEFEFFQAVRLLARMSSQRKPVGGTAKPTEEMFSGPTVHGLPS